MFTDKKKKEPLAEPSAEQLGEQLAKQSIKRALLELETIVKLPISSAISSDFLLNYVKIEDVNFSQDSVTLSKYTKYKTLNKARCNIPLIKLVYHNKNIYIIGFFGIEKDDSEKPKSDTESFPPQFPLIEVVDYGTMDPYVTINNRRLVHIYRFLYSIATMEEETKTSQQISKDLELYNIHDILEYLKSRFLEHNIIVDNIYIPVIIHKHIESYRFNLDETYEKFIENRLKRQQSFCKMQIVQNKTTKEFDLCKNFDEEFKYGVPVIPKIGYEGKNYRNSMYDKRQIPTLGKKRKLLVPKITYDTTKLTSSNRTYNYMLFDLFNITDNQERCIMAPKTSDDIKLKFQTICKCYTEEVRQLSSKSAAKKKAKIEARQRTKKDKAAVKKTEAEEEEYYDAQEHAEDEEEEEDEEDEEYFDAQDKRYLSQDLSQDTPSRRLSDPNPINLLPLLAKGRVKRTKKRKQCRKGTRRNKRTRRCKKHKMKRTLKR